MGETAFQYAKFYKSALNKEVTIPGDTLKLMLVDNNYVPDQTNHQYKSDCAAHEITGQGYTAGGITLAGTALVWDPLNSRWLVQTTTTPQWTNAIFTAYFGVVYDDTPSLPTAKVLLSCINFGGGKSPADGNFTVNWPATGVIYQKILPAA